MDPDILSLTPPKYKKYINKNVYIKKNSNKKKKEKYIDKYYDNSFLKDYFNKEILVI